MNRERLLKLADFLETKVPENQFNMRVWHNKMPGECGFAACAMGWVAVLWPEHIQLTNYGIWMNELENGYNIAMEFFDIHSFQARYLFSPGFYDYPPKPINVANRIRGFVNNEVQKA